MSKFRRKLLISESRSRFKKVIDAINELPGYKSILRKFDDSQLVWILRYANKSATSHDLYVFDLNGQIVDRILSLPSKYHHGVVINNYACVYSGTDNYDITFDVIQLTTSGLNKIRNSVPVKNWVSGYLYFAYINSQDNSYHVCGTSNGTYLCVYDYNITTNTISRQESSRYYLIIWYHYNGEYFEGLLHWYGDRSPVINPSYIKKTNTVNVYSNFNFSPSITGVGATLFPIFDYKNRYEDLLYEVYYRTSTGAFWQNVLGLDRENPINLTLGNIAIRYTDNNTYSPTTLGMISYIDNGEFHAYSYNQSTGLVELMV